MAPRGCASWLRGPPPQPLHPALPRCTPLHTAATRCRPQAPSVDLDALGRRMTECEGLLDEHSSMVQVRQGFGGLGGLEGWRCAGTGRPGTGRVCTAGEHALSDETVAACIPTMCILTNEPSSSTHEMFTHTHTLTGAVFFTPLPPGAIQGPAHGARAGGGRGAAAGCGGRGRQQRRGGGGRRRHQAGGAA